MIILKKTAPNEIEYRINNFNRLSVVHNSPLMVLPLPEQSAKDALLWKIEGNSETIDLGWTILREKVTPIVGSSLLEPNEIWEFLEDNFQPLGFLDRYSLQIGNVIRKGVIQKMSYSGDVDNNIVTWGVDASFVVGADIILEPADEGDDI